MSEIKTPIPQGKYVPAVRFARLIYTAGMTPRQDGKLICVGKVPLEADIADYRQAMTLATENALHAAAALLEPGERLLPLSATVYINAAEGFTLHSKLADFASDAIVEHLGAPVSRAAVGVATLPGNAPFEVQLVLGVTEA